MTDLVRYENPTSSIELAGTAWPIAQQIARTEFVPAALRGKPEAVLACIMTGHELGIGAMQSLAKIHVIEGRPAKSTASRLGDDDIGIAGTVSFAVRESTCAAVPAGESCTVWVTYSPLFPGPVEAYLVLPDPSTGDRYRSSLAGFVG